MPERGAGSTCPSAGLPSNPTEGRKPKCHTTGKRLPCLSRRFAEGRKRAAIRVSGYRVYQEGLPGAKERAAIRVSGYRAYRAICGRFPPAGLSSGLADGRKPLFCTTDKRLPCLSRRLAGGERESRNTGKRLPCLPSDMRAVSTSGATERSCRRARAVSAQLSAEQAYRGAEA